MRGVSAGKARETPSPGDVLPVCSELPQSAACPGQVPGLSCGQAANCHAIDAFSGRGYRLIFINSESISSVVVITRELAW